MGSSNYHCDEKDWYIESQVVNVDCLLFIEQAEGFSPGQMTDFARTVIGEYGARRPLSLLSEDALENSTDEELINEALKYLRADSVLHVQMQTDSQKSESRRPNSFIERRLVPEW